MNNCILISASEIVKTCASQPLRGKRLLEPLKSISSTHHIPLNILEDVEITETEAEVHLNEADLWFGLEGEVTFICGGTLVRPTLRKNANGTENPNELKGEDIVGGKEIIVRSGDWLWIPAGQPHKHICNGVGRVIIIKIPQQS